MSAYKMLKSYIEDEGMDPEDAVEMLRANAPATDVWDFVHSFVLSQARHIQNRMITRQWRERLIPDESLPSSSRHLARKKENGTRYNPVADFKLPKIVYKLSDGRKKSWGELTLEDISREISYYRKALGKTVSHIMVLENAYKLMMDAGADRLDEIPDWEEKLRDMGVDESGKIREQPGGDTIPV